MATATDVRLLVHWHDEATRARGRESLLAAMILHLGLVMLILISPKILPGQEVVEAVDLRGQEFTVLTLPSDLLPEPESQPQPDLTPEERQRITVGKPLVLDPRELRRILPPSEDSPPGGESELSLPRAETGGEPEGSPEPKEFARLELEDIPRPNDRDQTRLQFPPSSPGRTIEESLRRGQGGSPAGPPGGVGSGPIQPNFNTPFPTILSDTRGVDFSPYLIRLLREVRQNWYAVIPESARWGEKGRVVIVFTIFQDGSVPRGQPTVVLSSGRSHLDRPTLGAIRASEPFPPLPEEFTGEHIVIQFTFLYNLPLGYTGP